MLDVRYPGLSSTFLSNQACAAVDLLPVAALGTLMLATRTLYAVFDPVVGLLVDRSGSRWGVVYGVTLLIVAAVGGARNGGFGIAAAPWVARFYR